MTHAPATAGRTALTELGRYRLVRHLASGGMGDVYLAEAAGAAGFAKRVVIKVLRADLASDPQLIAQLVAEGRLLEALDHPNIAQILDIGQQGEVFWLAMEYVEGFDLRALLRALPPVDGARRLGPPAVLHVVASVARALEHAQTRRGTDGQPLSIVHHDVSPSNVMVRRDGHVKLVDFGVARASVMGRLTAGALRGKLPYLSPEHTHGRSIDGRADVFALGLVAFELLSGSRAVDITEPSELDAAHGRLGGRVESLRALGLPAALCDLVGDMTAVDPAARCSSAAEVADRAEALLVTLGEGSAARTLAAAVSAAFDHLEARQGSFDQTLAGILGLADSGTGDDRTGTLSLPGLDVMAVATASARDEHAAPPRRWKKRWVTLALATLALALGGGYWIGQRAPAAPSATATATAAGSPAAAARPSTEAGRPAHADPAGHATALAATATATSVQQATVLPAPATTATDPATAAVARKVVATGQRTERTATLRFRVQPFDCRVSVDGELRRPSGQSDRYELRVAPGDHRIRVEDPATGLRREVWVRDVRDGEERILKGGICLGDGCPTVVPGGGP